MKPFGALLFTSMNPLDVKIWIAGCRVADCRALHTSKLGERTTIVPSRAFPSPVNRRSGRLPGEDVASWVELWVEPPPDFAAPCAERADWVSPRVPGEVAVFAEVTV